MFKEDSDAAPDPALRWPLDALAPFLFAILNVRTNDCASNHGAGRELLAQGMFAQTITLDNAALAESGQFGLGLED